MDKREDIPAEEETSTDKSAWQATKESWYDKIPLTGKQLDTIVIVCWIAIIAVTVIITLDAMNVFNPFGY